VSTKLQSLEDKFRRGLVASYDPLAPSFIASSSINTNSKVQVEEGPQKSKQARCTNY
jgi:hypothetical protein